MNQILNLMSAPVEENPAVITSKNGFFSTPGELQLSLTEDDLEIIQQYEEEERRLGNFERIYPLHANAQHYSKFFEHIRPANELLAKYLRISSRVVSS